MRHYELGERRGGREGVVGINKLTKVREEGREEKNKTYLLPSTRPRHLLQGTQLPMHTKRRTLLMLPHFLRLGRLLILLKKSPCRLIRPILQPSLPPSPPPPSSTTIPGGLAYKNAIDPLALLFFSMSVASIVMLLILLLAISAKCCASNSFPKASAASFSRSSLAAVSCSAIQTLRMFCWVPGCQP